MFGVDELKIDSTLIKTDNLLYLLMLNFNFPITHVNDRPRFERLLDVTNQYLTDMFRGSTLKYKINASYHLRHSETGDVRLFTGSFFMDRIKIDKTLSLSGSEFLTYDVQTFKQNVINCTNERHIRSVLLWTDLSSKWVFDSVVSIIINVQATVSHTIRFVQLHNLLVPPISIYPVPLPCL